MKHRLLIIAAAASCIVACAPKAKEVYIPKDLAEMDLEDTASLWCRSRSIENDDIVIFWQKGFGPDVAEAPDYLGHDMKVDLDNLLERTQHFYDFYRNEMEFIQKGSNADRYKMMVMLMYSDEGTAYGGDYDGVIGGLWITPLRTHDKNLNCIAHELGHSFQAQVSADTGSGFGGGGIYEMTSQWMLWNVNDDWMTSENYHWDAFMNQTHYAFMHPENMYRSPYVLEYWSNRHGLKVIGNLWRAAGQRHDVVGVYEEYTGIGDDEFAEEMYDYASRSMTYDFDRVREVAAPYANRHRGKLAEADADGWQAIAENQVPQQYGYNGIEIAVPAPGATVNVTLRGGEAYLGPEQTLPAWFEEEGDDTPEEVGGSVGIELGEGKAAVPTREEAIAGAAQEAGWTFGLVGVRQDSTPLYSEHVRVDGGGSEGSIRFTVPQDEALSHLWLVVVATPAHHVDVLEWHNDYLLNFPYSVKIEM